MLPLTTWSSPVGFYATKFSGQGVNEQDLAPNLSGTLSSLTNSVASAAGFASAELVAYLTQGKVGYHIGTRETPMAIARIKA